MRLTILGPNIGTGGQFHVHRAGCADVKKRGNYKRAVAAGEVDTADYADARAVVHSVYPPEDFGYAPEEWRDYAGDVLFFPCIEDALPLERIGDR